MTIPVDMGDQAFIVGPNGSGKSALIQHGVTSLGAHNVRRISAHRQTWLQSAAINITPQSRRQFDQNLRAQDSNPEYRWREWSSEQQVTSVLFDLTAKENDLARRIMEKSYAGEQTAVEEIIARERPAFEQINDLLSQGGFAVTIRNSRGEEILTQHRQSGVSYSMAQMSDGERNAVILAANVLTVSPGTVLLIDEPERHLHRSIIEPLLSALFAQRTDCAFLISTHEIALPIANPAAKVVILRSCLWDGNQARAWDAEVLEPGTSLPEELKRDVLGARRRVLFVEGARSSLDLSLYGALFPELSVIPKGSREEVIRAIKGLRGSYEHHHVEAIGLIDRDDRTQDEVDELLQDKVVALDVCSVESLYYCSDAIEAVACRQAESLGRDPQVMLEAVKQSALEAIGADQDLPERMAARRSERLVYNRFATHVPDWKEIRAAGEQLTISEPIKNPYQDELNHFNGLVESGDLDGLLVRYPLRESSVFARIVTTLGCRNQADYERMVVARVRDDINLAENLKERIRPLAELLDAQTSHDS